jgi:hypothetical protein
VDRHLASGVAFLAYDESAMRIDDPPLGNLTKPSEDFSLAKLGLRQAANGFGARFLQYVIGLDLAAKRRTQPPFDKSGKLRPTHGQKITQRLFVVRADPLDQYRIRIRHLTFPLPLNRKGLAGPIVPRGALDTKQMAFGSRCRNIQLVADADGGKFSDLAMAGNRRAATGFSQIE